ncbi:MAG: NUDIX hydrolase [Anaerolineales bacterium]|jgi:ADP-ribose pyrophosphatase
MSYRLLNSRTVFKGRVFRVRVDEIEPPSGGSMRRDVVEHPGSVTIVPIDQEDQIWFVRQYRHPAQQALLELPAGTLKNGEDPESCAMRECREEIGMSPGDMQALPGFFIAPGYSTEFMQLFLARELTPSPLPPDKHENIRVERKSLAEARSLLAHGELRDGKTIAALVYALNVLGKPDS